MRRFKYFIKRVTIYINRMYLLYTFKFCIKHGFSLIVGTKGKRQIGKTNILVKLSKSKNIPILVRHKSNYDYIKRNHNHNNIIHVPTIQSLRGKRSEHGVFIEEGFSPEEIFCIKNIYKGKVFGYYDGR